MNEELDGDRAAPGEQVPATSTREPATREPATPQPVAPEPVAAAPAASEEGGDAPGRRLRVALFTDNYGPGPSGILYAVQFIEEALAGAGHECLVVAPACDGPNPHRGAPGRRELRLPSIRLPGVPARLASGRGFERALEELRRDPPDVIHCHGLGSVGLLAWGAARRCGVPMVVTWHTDFEAYADHYATLTPFLDAWVKLLRLNVDGLDRAAVKRMLRDLRSSVRHPRGMSRRALLNVAADMLTFADVVTTPSDKTAARVKEMAPAARVRVCPNGADALPPGPPLPPAAGPRITYIGRIAPEKGIGLLLDAFAWVREDIPDAELMIVGDWRAGGPALTRLLGRARGRDGVNLVGHVPRERLGPYYEAADVFCFPSLTDTQALVLHEAAHAGAPIGSVAPELGLGSDEGVTGAFARPTPESLARALVAMLRALQEPACREAARARSRALAARWTIERQTAEMLQLYADVAAGRTVPERLTRAEAD